MNNFWVMNCINPVYSGLPILCIVPGENMQKAVPKIIHGYNMPDAVKNIDFDDYTCCIYILL